MKNLFEKRSTRQWSEEVFMIAKVYITDLITYALEETFYLEELKTV